MKKDLVLDKEVLSTPCEKVTADDGELVQDLLDTLASLDEAACLAANQIGVCKQACVYLDENDTPHVMLNPVMKRALYPMKTTEECFTVEGESKVTRFGKISVEFEELIDGKLVSRKREFIGNEAQAIQHMIDHFKGKVI